MATRQKKTEKRKSKRQQKQRLLRSRQLSSYQRMAGDAYPLRTCLVNAEWREEGMASIYLARDIAPGRVTFASFLVDQLALGLKDAWGEVDLGLSEFQDLMRRTEDQFETTTLDITTARHLVYGGIELARELGFRLPKHYEKWTGVLGKLDAGISPNRQLFLDDGVIVLACTYRDFAKRLIGCSPEAFLARPDVEAAFADGDYSLLDEEAVDSVTGELAATMLEKAQQWCFAHGQRPHPRLPDVIDALLGATAESLDRDADSNDGPIEIPETFSEEMLDRALATLVSKCRNNQDARGIGEAMDQLFHFMSAFQSEESFAKSMGPNPDS